MLAHVGGACTNCIKGTYLRGGKGELVCSACSRRVVLEPPARESTNRRNPEQDQGLLSEGDVFIIVDALTEQYLRARGNVRRSKLDLTRRLNTEKADYLDSLIAKIRRL